MVVSRVAAAAEVRVAMPGDARVAAASLVAARSVAAAMAACVAQEVATVAATVAVGTGAQCCMP